MRRLLVFAAPLVLLVLLVMLTPLTAPAVTPDAAPGRPESWLAAGDSFSAGYGLPGSGGPCTKAASGSWPQRAKARVAWSGRFDDVSCSGDVTDDLFSRWDGTTRYDLVTFSYGGNDIHFREILIACAGLSIIGTPTERFDWLSDTLATCPPDAAINALVDTLSGRYQDFLRRVTAMVEEGGNVIVMGYPAIFEEPHLWNATAKVVGLCHAVDADGARRIRGWAGRLNALIGNAVSAVNGHNKVRFTFINPQDGAGNIAPAGPEALWEQPGSPHRHNLCGTDSWMYGPFDGQYHPNEAGHDAMSMLAERTIARLDWSGLDQAPPATTAPATSPPPATPTTRAPGTTAPPATSPPTTQPRGPQSRDLVVVIYGGGHVGVAWDLTWDPGRDPVTCHFLIDGVERFTAQCGLHSSKQFYGISPGNHSFSAYVTDRDGIAGNTLGPISRTVT